MKIPTELLFSNIKGGYFLETGRYSGEWHRAGKIIASWRRGKDGQAVVEWKDERDKRAAAQEGKEL